MIRVSPPNKKPTSFWHSKALTARRKELHKKMLIGDADSARKLLSRSVESLAIAINESNLEDHHVIALDYLRTSILQYLDGNKLDVAFGIAAEGGGRPRISISKKWEIFESLSTEVEKLKNSGVDNPITQAQKNVANQFSCSISTVRRVWDKETQKA